jgi:ABC-type antimicrobial peptide transport system permease subunit
MPAMVLHVATRGDPASLLGTVRQEVQELDPDLPWIEESTMAAAVKDALWAPALIAGLFSLFGALALVIAMVGIYSVISFVVSHRRRELGIRMAIGARRADVVMLILRLGLELAGIGAVVGWLAAKLLVPLVRSLLYGVSGSSFLLDGAVLLGLLGLSAASTILATRAVARIQPSEALRSL